MYLTSYTYSSRNTGIMLWGRQDHLCFDIAKYAKDGLCVGYWRHECKDRTYTGRDFSLET